jgi:four helix bundle protein
MISIFEIIPFFMIKSFSDLDVYQLSFQFAMEIFLLSKTFPGEEKYSLTSQIIRSSRSISANISEGFGKRFYENEFKRHLVYSAGSLEETKTWLSFAHSCGYITETEFSILELKTKEIGAKLFKLYKNWKSIN